MTKSKPGTFFTASLTIGSGLSDDQAGLFSDAFALESVSFSCRKNGKGWDFLWTFPQGLSVSRDDLAERLGYLLEAFGLDAALAKSLTLEENEDRNWLAECYRALPPLTIEPFFIYGSHFDGSPPENTIPLLIEAATAFGSGEHGTTASCLQALAALKDRGFTPPRILDMGCGSGILAAAAARLWPDSAVIAADNDPECVAVSEKHVRVNAIPNISVYLSDGYAANSPVWEHAPYPLIIANILAGPLIDMAEAQCRALSAGGYIILSGTLQEQGEHVAAAYKSHGCELAEIFPGGEWVTLLMRKT
jgi:ribosomal protein L11 methyltransferase